MTAVTEFGKFHQQGHSPVGRFNKHPDTMQVIVRAGTSAVALKAYAIVEEGDTVKIYDKTNSNVVGSYTSSWNIM